MRRQGRAGKMVIRSRPVSAGEPLAGILLVESTALAAHQPSLIEQLNAADRQLLLGHSTRRVLRRGELLFRQGDPHDGIVIVESGRVRSFYVAPSGREITLAYWSSGNFI